MVTQEPTTPGGRGILFHMLAEGVSLDPASTVTVSAAGAEGYVLVDALRLTCTGPPAEVACPVGGISVGNAPGVCSAVVRYDLPAPETDDPFVLVLGLGPGARFPLGTTQELYLLIHSTGMSTECGFPVTVADTEPPALACHSLHLPAEHGTCSALVTMGSSLADALDNCGSATLTAPNRTGTAWRMPVGRSLLPISASDGRNVASCTATVTVQDTQVKKKGKKKKEKKGEKIKEIRKIGKKKGEWGKRKKGKRENSHI
jgi:hypothetical protein